MPNSTLVLVKNKTIKSFMCLRYCWFELMKYTIPKKIPVLFSQPKKILASFIDPKKSLLANMSDRKKSFGPPRHQNMWVGPLGYRPFHFSLSLVPRSTKGLPRTSSPLHQRPVFRVPRSTKGLFTGYILVMQFLEARAPIFLTCKCSRRILQSAKQLPNPKQLSFLQNEPAN